MHRLLKRQIRRSFGAEPPSGEAHEKFFDAVEQAYREYDDDRGMLERSLELSSDELLRANGELNVIFASLPDLFVRLDRGGDVVDMRGGQGTDVNLVADGARRGALEEVLVAPAAAAIRRILMADVVPLKGIVTHYQLGDALAPTHFEARLLPLPQRDTMVVIRDVSERVQGELAEVRRLEQAARVRAMEEFAFVASHDLRAPLRAISQLAEWLAEDLDDIAGESKEHLSLLRRRVQRMDDLMVGLLDYSRVGREKVDVEEVDVRDIVRGVVELLESERFVFDVRALPRLTTASGPLERVFLNLITNAVKHHHQGGGRVSVGFDDGDRFVTFYVEDDGPGIPVDARERIFKMFQKLKRQDEVEGSGMGLALIKRIVEEAGGEIFVAAAAGGGARFSFTWPRVWQKAG